MKVVGASLFYLLCYISVYSQNSQALQQHINWQKSSAQIKNFSFPGATFDEDKLPVYHEKLSLNLNAVTFDVVLSQMVFEEVISLPHDIIKSRIPAEISLQKYVAYEKKQPFGIVSFVPLRQKSDGKIERLISFHLDIKEGQSFEKKLSTPKTYAPVSVLKSGNWYKIGVTADGIYQMSYTFLSSLGIPVAAIDPANIRIYGNGGGMLPAKNSDFRNDDLVENAIFVNGQSDGKFDNSDYVLFYGQGPHRWYYDNKGHQYKHKIHSYTDTTFYFLNVEIGPGKRLVQSASAIGSVTNTVTTFDDFYYHEQNSVNLLSSGREWYGELFDIVTTKNFNFTLPDVDVNSPVMVTADVIAQSSLISTSFTLKANQTELLTIPVPLSGKDFTQNFASAPAIESPVSAKFNVSSQDLQISLTFNKSSSAKGWLNFLEVNSRRNLILTGNQVQFRDHASLGPGNISQFLLRNSSSGTTIWDITDPLNPKIQEATLSNGSLVFNASTAQLNEYLAFNQTGFYIPSFSGKVENQNLHGIPQSDMVIIVYPDFTKEANRLAEYHRTKDSMTVQVIQLDQIYNEFSSGCQDITAIRDFMKMLYDRAGTDKKLLPKNLLLFGDASYNYKGRSGNSNFVPSYEAENSLGPTFSFVTDDYYAYLDDHEGIIEEVLSPDFSQLLDINVGRFPVQTIEQSKAAVDKILHYTSPAPEVATTNSIVCESNSANGSSFGDWRNSVCFVADKGSYTLEFDDTYLHEIQADGNATILSNNNREYNIDKIYLNAYRQVSTPGGTRFPEAKVDLNKRVDKGALIINYTGHGGEQGWSASRVLEISDIESWSNYNKLALFMTATCEFSRFDNPERTSAGELVFLKKNGGGIALLTTVRLVYASTNEVLNNHFYNTVFKPINGRMPTIGEVFTITKNEAGGNHNFTLLGDPALTLAYPVNKVATLAINDKNITKVPDTLTALSKVTVKGSIINKTGQKMSQFNGIIYPTVFDKPETIYNDEGAGQFVDTNQFRFSLQKNVLYKGKVSVTNGDFAYSFLIPKDISYKYGLGKFSYYSDNGVVDANGSFENVIIGGSPRNVKADTKGPVVRLYLNDEKFISGGTTDEHPTIKALVSDSSGVNTVGNGIGHDITAILDGDASHVLVLNDYYQSDLNSYQNGKINYKLARLKEGKHTLKLKVWDVYNNSSENYLEFYVTNSADFTLNHVLNYPNPFSTRTSFYFEHNKACSQLDVQIQIYTLSGRLIKTIEENRLHSDGYRIGPINWDGRDDFGDKLARGLYIYRINVRSLSDGSSADKYEKLVILN